MSELLLGWPNGTLGMLLGSLAALVILAQAWRTAAWDIHDESSYQEPARLSMSVLAPYIVMFTSLCTLMLGVGTLDRHVAPQFGMLGDFLGLLILPLAIFQVLKVGRTF